MFKRFLLASITGFTLVVSPANVAHSADVIGLSLPLEGRNGPVAERIEFGAQLALQQLNKQGKDIELKLISDNCDVKAAATHANDFLQSDAKIIIGPLCYRYAAALAKSLNTTNGETPTIPVIAINNRNKALSRARSVDELPLYSISNPYDAEAKAIVNYILPRFDGKPYAILDDGSVYGRGLSDRLQLIADAKGFKPTVTANFRPLQTTYLATLRRLRNSGIEAVFIAAGAEDVVTMTRDINTLGLDWKRAAGEPAFLLPYTPLAGEVAPGLMIVRESAPTAQQIEALKDVVPDDGPEADSSLLLGYTAMQIAAKALDGNLDGEFDTVLGKLKFNDEGRTTPFPFALYQWNGNSLEKQ